MRRLVLLLSAWVLGSAALAAEAPLRPQTQDAKDLDTLYARLARTRYPDEAAGIVAAIDRLRLNSGSDAADLLLGRALKARAGQDWPLALQLFDAVVDFDPDWSQAWSERGTARLQSGDISGAMADIAQALKREPRDLDALEGLGALLLDAGDAEAAIKVYDRALTLAPAFAPLKEARARARTKLWGLSP